MVWEVGQGTCPGVYVGPAAGLWGGGHLDPGLQNHLHFLEVDDAICRDLEHLLGLPDGARVKNLPANA